MILDNYKILSDILILFACIISQCLGVYTFKSAGHAHFSRVLLPFPIHLHMFLCAAETLNLITYISQHGLHGEISFRQFNETVVEIKCDLETTVQYPDQVWHWAFHEFPVDYTNINPVDRCGIESIGAQLHRRGPEFLVLPGNETSTWYHNLQLIGDNGIWGRSLVLTEISRNVKICATITTVQRSLEHKAVARFNTPLAGSVFFHWLAPTQGSIGDTLIYANLYHIQAQSHNDDMNKTTTSHNWKIFVTDIFKNDHHRSEENCNFLQIVFDPQGNGKNKGFGDLDARLGKLQVAKNVLRSSKRMIFRDAFLTILPSDLSIPHRTLYLVIFDNLHPENYLACTQIRHVDFLLYNLFKIR